MSVHLESIAIALGVLGGRDLAALAVRRLRARRAPAPVAVEVPAGLEWLATDAPAGDLREAMTKAAGPVYELEALVQVAERFEGLDSDERDERLEELCLLAARTLTSDQMRALDALRSVITWVVEP